MAVGEHDMVTDVKLEETNHWIVACWVVIETRRHHRVCKHKNNVVKAYLNKFHRDRVNKWSRARLRS